jgi:hypothetical protein
VLEETGHQDARSPGHDVFGAVAVVHVEVDHGHPLQVVALQRVLGRHGHVVEKAEAHGLVTAGMVAGRAHGAEGVVQLAAITASVAARRRRPRAARHRQVWTLMEVSGSSCACGATRQHLFAQHVAQAAQGRHVHAAWASSMSASEAGGLARSSASPTPVISKRSSSWRPAARGIRDGRAHFVFAAIGVV